MAEKADATQGPAPRPSPNCLSDRAVWAVVLGAVILRVAWVVFTAHQPSGLSDPSFYLGSGLSIAAGDGYTSTSGALTAFFPPGYPFFLGAVIYELQWLGLGGHLPLGIGLAQAILGGVTVLAAACAAWTISGRRLALTTAVLVALWPNLIVYTSALLSETLFLALFTVFVALLLRAISAVGSSPTRGWLPLLSAAAFVLGLATLVRPQSGLLAVPVLAVVWLAVGVPWRRAAAWTSVLLLGVVVVVAPWSVRNTLLFGEFVPISTNTGANLCIGFNPEAYGGFSFTELCASEDSHVQGVLSERRSDRELTRRAISSAVADPARLPALTWNKIVITFALEDDGVRGMESYGDAPVLTEGQRSWVLRIATVYYWAMIALAVMGLLLMSFAAVRKAGGRVQRVTLLALIVAAGFLPVMLSFGDPRFKVPIYPLLAILAATSLTTMLGWIQERGWGQDAREEQADGGSRAGHRGADPSSPERNDSGLTEPQVTSTVTQGKFGSDSVHEGKIDHG